MNSTTIKVAVAMVAATATAAGLTCVGAEAALAGAKTPLTAGYTAGAPAGTSSDLTFVVPTIDCASAPDSSVFFGNEFHGTTDSGDTLRAGVLASCDSGTPTYAWGEEYGNDSTSFNAAGSAAPGDEIEVQLAIQYIAGSPTQYLQVIDGRNGAYNDVYPSDTSTLLFEASTSAVGAPSPAFQPVAFSATFDDAPLAAASPTKSRQASTGKYNVLSVTSLHKSRFSVVYRGGSSVSS